MSRAKTVDDHFLPGVSFTLDGEVLPARELSWVMFSSCGCVAAMHMMTTDTINEEAAWKQLSGNAQMIKQDKARGFTIRMAKHRDISSDDCTHSPKFGYVPTPIPIGHLWATTRSARCLHLVPLSAAEKDKADPNAPEWVEDDRDWLNKTSSMCGKATEPVRVWTRKWYNTDGKVECSRCVKLAEAQVIPHE